MPGTVVQMVRKTVYVESAAQYIVVATCVARGSLPDTGIFIYEIDDETDPKDDAFLRVVELADFLAYPRNRDDALKQNLTFWRSTSLILRYEDVATANAAWKELSARINALVRNHETYATEFETSEEGQTLTYPNADESTRTSLIEVFQQKESALSEAQAAHAAKVQECAGDEDAITEAQLQLTGAEADLKNYLLVQASLTALSTTYTTAHSALVVGNSQLRTLVASSDATTTQQDALLAQLSQDQAQLTLLGNQNIALGSALTGGVSQAVATLQARVIAYTQARTARVSELNQCSAEIARLQAAVTVAQEERDRALEAVLEVCPDFNPG